MSKLHITELKKSPASQFNLLSKAETDLVLGGSSYYYRQGIFNFSAYISSRFNIDLDIDPKDLKPISKDGTYKITIGGKDYSFTSQFKTGSNVHNYSLVSL